MGKTLTEKILEQHLVEGKSERGSDISIKIDQTLTQDATGTMAYLQFEAIGIQRIQTELSVSYVDHNTLQTDFRNPDDHRYLQSIAAKYGLYFSRPGNGICHQLHLERFARPGKTLLGSDSHTPTGGGVGMISIGAGGLDVAAAMAGEAFHLKMPNVIKVHLTGKLPDFVSAKDVILEVLRRIGVKGAVNKVLEYTALKLVHVTKGNNRLFFYIICIFTALTVAFIEDLTLALILAPLIYRTCRILEIPPGTYMMGMTITINIGAILTPISSIKNHPVHNMILVLIHFHKFLF